MTTLKFASLEWKKIHYFILFFEGTPKNSYAVTVSENNLEMNEWMSKKNEGDWENLKNGERIKYYSLGFGDANLNVVKNDSSLVLQKLRSTFYHVIKIISNFFFHSVFFLHEKRIQYEKEFRTQIRE